jgi:GGDEF domain-containing protein
MTATVNQRNGQGLFDQETLVYEPSVFAHLVEREVRRAMRYQEFLAVLAVALEDPRETRVPAALLRLAADHIYGEVRTTDIVGRLGDALGIALVCVTEEDARLVARRLLTRLQGVAETSAKLSGGGASVRIGGACFPKSGSDARTLLEVSLSAVQHANESPSGGVCFRN